MFHYLFTNDLRISRLNVVLKEAGECFLTNTVPSGTDEKNVNNNMKTLGFYFNLTSNSICTTECAQGNTRKVVLNFIKKFQFPNPRTSESLCASIADCIQLAPMRVILQILYTMKMQNHPNVFLSTDEILNFVFYNNNVAKSDVVNLNELIQQIDNYRNDGVLPPNIEVDTLKKLWNQDKRQIREMVKVLTWAGCVKEKTNGSITLDFDGLTIDNKADLFDVLTYSDYWIPLNNNEFKEEKASYQLYMDIDTTEKTGKGAANERTLQEDFLCFETAYKSKFTSNRILFGAPGTGKSYTLNKEKDELLFDGGDYERVTFHPDYSYANFVGTYKPVQTKGEDGKDAITYEYVPGPFMRVYVNALKSGRTDIPKPQLLIIEEINRANIATVFGDVFQLLDRDKNVSEYPIMPSKELKEYLAKSDVLGGKSEDYDIIKIPDNMFIWATMNSADQGVFPMDTAFKRRWDFTYLGIDDGENDMSDAIKNKKHLIGTGSYARLVKWNDIRKSINEVLSSEEYNVNEDKLLGLYFISKAILEMEDDTEFIKVFKNKVLMYLYDDAAMQKKKTLFQKCKDEVKGVRYSDVYRQFDTKGVFIFPEELSKKFEEKPFVSVGIEEDAE